MTASADSSGQTSFVTCHEVRCKWQRSCVCEEVQLKLEDGRPLYGVLSRAVRQPATFAENVHRFLESSTTFVQDTSLDGQRPAPCSVKI